MNPPRGRDLSCPADPLCAEPLMAWETDDDDPAGPPTLWVGCPKHGGIRTITRFGEPGLLYDADPQSPSA
jgi:hypothetical protein